MGATKGFKDYIFMAACEWFLMFWIFIDAALAYSLTKFAKKCQLQIPCLLCSRLDHFFDNEEPGSNSCLDLFCNKHQVDISNLIYCDLHNELKDVREMCEDCFNSATLQNQSNFRRSYLNKNYDGILCSCCRRQWKEKHVFGHQRSSEPNLVVGSKQSKPTTKPPLPRVARHGRPKRTRSTRAKEHHNDASFPIGYPDLKFTSDSEFEFLFSDDDGDGTFKAADVSEREDTYSGNRYNVFERRTYSTPDLTSYACLQHNDNSRTRTRTRTRSSSLTPSFLTRNSLADLNRATEARKQISSMSSTRLWIDSLKKANGIGSFGGSTMSCSSGSQNRYNTFSRNSYSASDLGSGFLLEMHYNKSQPRRSASLTPNSYSASNSLQPSSSRSSIGFWVPLSYADRHGSLDGSMVAFSSGSQNRYNMFSRNSFSASNLGSAFLLETDNNNKSQPRRSASLTPNSAAVHGSREFQYQMKVDPPYVRKHIKPVSSRQYGHLDDSVIRRKTGGGHYNHNTIPRRHSYSVFQLGGDILLNMPTDESFTSSAFLDPYNSLRREKGEQINQELPNDFRSDLSNAYINKSREYGFLDDSVVSRSRGSQYQNNVPRRHSHSFFEFGCEVLLNMPHNESIANDSGGFVFGDPNNMNFQRRSSPSDDVTQISHQKAKEDKKSFPSSNRAYGYKSSDDFYVSGKTSNNSHNVNKNPRRHSYSAFELGCAYLLDMSPFDECLTNRSASLTPNVSYDSVDIDSLINALQFPQQMDFFRSLDDSVVSRKTSNHIHNQNSIPRRHSYSVFQLGGDILLNMPVDESFTSHSTSKFQKVENDKKPLPPMRSVKSDLSIDRTKWHGSFDDYLVLRSMANRNQNQNNVSRRHSISTFDLGPGLIVEVQVDQNLKNMHPSLASNSSTEHSFADHHRAHHHHHHRAKRDKKMLPPLIPMNGSSDVRSDLFNKANDYQRSNPRRHSYSAFELQCGLMLNTQRDRNSRRRSASVTPKIQTNHIRKSYSTSDLKSLQTNPNESFTFKSSSLTPSCSTSQGFGDLNLLTFQTGPSSSLQKYKKSDRQKGKKSKKFISSVNNVNNKTDRDEFFDRYRTFSRNSQSASDLGSLEMHHDGNSRSRSKSLTPDCYFYVQSDVNYHLEMEKGKKNLPKETTSPTSIKNDLCPSCIDKIDLRRSLDGSTISEVEYEGIERVKRKAEDDVRCMRLLQSELEAERNAATVAANHAMNMITRLQQEKASLQMEALQYLRMMEEQAEYDMEALQKANELVEEKENEIQDLLDELEQYRSTYGDELLNNIKSFEDEKKYILESLSEIEKKIHQLSNGVDKSQENESHAETSKKMVSKDGGEVDLATLEHEIMDLKQKMGTLQADLDFLKHACNTLRGSEGLVFIQDIAHQLQDLRKHVR